MTIQIIFAPCKRGIWFLYIADAVGLITFNKPLEGFHHRRAFNQVCLQIDPEFYEWGLQRD